MEPGSRLPGHQPHHLDGAVAGQQEPEDIAIIVASPGWHRAIPGATRLARRAARAALAEWPEEMDSVVSAAPGASVSAGTGAGAITVLLADDRALKRLNTEHRGKVKPTNVLSFPGIPEAGHLGDIALSLPTLRREAAASGRSLPAHFAHLVTHGVLHLIGHDHLEAGEARRMEQAESRVLHRLGLPNPWPAGGRLTGKERE